MTLALQIPAGSTTLWTNNSGVEVEITTLHVSCGNTLGASFFLKYVPKNGSQFFMTSKLFTPPQLATWDYPGLTPGPFLMQPGDSIVGSASDASNYDLLMTWRPAPQV